MNNFEIVNEIYQNVNREYGIHPNNTLLDILEFAENRLGTYLDTNDGWDKFLDWMITL